ncbi:hypothetical protein BV898_15949 [Hypsibius exemplaris]|uniref:Uncharacterized protein n=1 Tax=Hypsibius exemplaris TaxID=2072580 RepID=A0A9X6RKQ7_HYPEX|nr:hypothetical protein BV898_15949 [Hypsibius exemplaris]
MGVCTAFLQRSNRFIRAEFGRLFRRDAFNMDSLERTIDFTYYESYSERALRVLRDSRRRAVDKDRTDRERPRLSPRSYRLRLSDDLVKPTFTDWRARVAALPPIWKSVTKKPFYVQQASVPDIKDYPNHKHRIAKEMRQNSPVLDFQLAQKYYKLRDKVLHTVPGAEEVSLMAQLRQHHEPVRHIQRRNLTPFHITLGIMGKQLKLFDYWTLLPMMNDERKLTLPGLTKEARFKAFKITRLLFPRRTRRTRRLSRNAIPSSPELNEKKI